MAFTNLWKKLSPAGLAFVIQAFSLISIFLEGYDQDLVKVGIGLIDGTVTKTLHEGGIVSVYYLGAILGCFVGGYAADRIGRVNGMFYAALFAMLGGALQAASTSSDFIIAARVVTGVGTGALVGITPVYISEVATAQHRGGFLGYVFIANYLGISVAYWVSFGLSFIEGGRSEIRWRFLLAFQCIPAIMIVLGIRMLPDSPRFLVSAGRDAEAYEVLQHIRGPNASKAEIKHEYAEMLAASKQAHPSSPIMFAKILIGKSGQEGHIGRRAWLCIGLQIMASWTGITAVTAYSPVLLKAAGYSQLTQNGLAGGLNTVGIVGTIISATVVDHFGRRPCLMIGALGLSIVNFVAGALYEAARKDPSLSVSIAPGAVAMLFLFNIIYASTWGTVSFLIPTEIFPSEMRAQGNGFGITGWALGVGMTVLINPVMFGEIQNRTYFLFGALNLMWVPVVYCFYPETAGRSLESIWALFATDSAFNWDMEKSYRHHGDLLAEMEGSRSGLETDSAGRSPTVRSVGEDSVEEKGEKV